MSAPGPGRRFYTSGTRDYLPGLLALARSFRAFHPADELVVVLTPHNGLTGQDRTRLAAAGATVEDLAVSDLVSFIQARLPEHRSKYGMETYVKVVLVETACAPFYWIDSDMVVRSVIDPAGRGARGGLAAASPNPRPRASCFRDPADAALRDWIARCGGDPDGLFLATPSFNCGLMWLDPARLRDDGFLVLAREALDRFADQLVTADESLFNLLAHRLDIRFLPRRSQQYVRLGSTVNPASGASWVMHFVGSVKPWMTRASPTRRAYERWLEEGELEMGGPA